MSDIANIAGHLGAPTGRPSRLDRPEAAPAATPSTPPARFGRSGSDAVELSADARRHAAGHATQEPAPDMAKVARMKSLIAAGGYDSDARLRVAIDRMIDDVVG